MQRHTDLAQCLGEDRGCKPGRRGGGRGTGGRKGKGRRWGVLKGWEAREIRGM